MRAFSSLPYPACGPAAPGWFADADGVSPLQPRAAVPHTAQTRRPAFTLVELMVVIVLIGLLAGAVSLGVRGYLITGKQNIAKMEIAKIGQALETFYTAYDRFPANDEGLEALVQPSEKLPDGVLNKMPRDPWGHRYQYNQPGHSGPYDIICYGADGREGGQGADQDVSNAELDRAGA